MPAVEVWSERGRDRVVTLADHAYTVGSDPGSADIVLDDPTVSRVHATLERVGTAWLVRDLGSRNGTRLMGERLMGQRLLRDGDDIHVGHTRLVFRDAAVGSRPQTDAIEEPPSNLTRAERRILIELCRPVLSHNTFQAPASVREIGAQMYISKNAVQFHLTNLYAKFGIVEDVVNRREVLANEAVRRGAVTLGDLRRERPDEADEHA